MLGVVGKGIVAKGIVSKGIVAKGIVAKGIAAKCVVTNGLVVKRAVAKRIGNVEHTLGSFIGGDSEWCVNVWWLACGCVYNPLNLVILYYLCCISFTHADEIATFVKRCHTCKYSCVCQ